jgi:hypothetical protein
VTEEGGESPLPVIRKEFIVVWANNDTPSLYRGVTGSGITDGMLFLVNGHGVEDWINLDHVLSVEVTVQPDE